MKKVELKRIAEQLWKGSNPEEKTPFAHGSVSDNGSISKYSEPDDSIKKAGKEFSEEETEKIEGPMSIPRKICFAMSFNVWILYFLMLGWIIPCRYFNCNSSFNDVVETNLSSIWPLTNLETLNVKGLPSMVMIGHAEGSILRLSSMASNDGTFKWNNTLGFIPRKIQCNFEIMFDANEDGIADCLLTGYNDVYAFNASNGHVFWEQNLPSEEGNIVSKFHPTVKHASSSYLIGTCGDKVVVLSATNGTKITEVDLPCWSPFEVRIVPNIANPNFTIWSVVCDYGDKVEAWGFEEQELLKRRKSESSKEDSDDFTLLFKRESSSGGSIDLGCDVTSIPGGPLLLSWSDRVAMVTPKAIAWERHFPYPLTVANIKIGHFTSNKDLEVAAAVRNDTNSIVYILEARNGTTVTSTFLENRRVQSLEIISGDIDSLLVKSLFFNHSSYSLNNLTDPIPTENTNFVLIDFKDGSHMMNVVTSSAVVGSTVNMQTDGEASLLLLKTQDGGDVLYQKLVLRRSVKDSVFCVAGVKNPTHLSTEI